MIHLPGAISLNDLPKMKGQGLYEKLFPEGAVVHTTAGSSSHGRFTVEHALKMSHSYFVIDSGGFVYQQFDLAFWGYHAGKSFHPDLGSSLSKKLVGIEIQNPGKLDDDKISWFGKFYKDAKFYCEEENIEEGYYQNINALQYNSLKLLILKMRSLRPDVFKLDYVLGHDEISPGRKSDPGGALGMCMEDFREELRLSDFSGFVS